MERNLTRRTLLKGVLVGGGAITAPSIDIISHLTLHREITVASSPAVAGEEKLLHQLNHAYLEVHERYEKAFWADRMGLESAKPGELEHAEAAYKAYVSDPTPVPAIEAELKRTALTEEEKTGLAGWKRFYEVNAITSQAARAVQRALVALQSKVDRERKALEAGYTDPKTGAFVPATITKMRLMVTTDPDEALRKAAWEGLMAVDKAVGEKWIIPIVKMRNRLAREIGYANYYEMRVRQMEGISLDQVFSYLDELEQSTRDAARASFESMMQEKGESARQPWNFGYYASGASTENLDPYFPFEGAFAQWACSFTALGYDYSGATLQIDLVDRQGKFPNGFMHGPVPTYVENGVFHPASINFAANAVPGQVGSGRKALRTFLHEGGHAVHFSNVRMPGPHFSQERAPTSVAYAETQSMFSDSISDDPEWMIRYAKEKNGQRIPDELILEAAIERQRYAARTQRSLLIIPYVERALYTMPEDELTPENVLKLTREIEQKLVFTNGREAPTLQHIHVLSAEASGYYHAYTMADMAVRQTRNYLMRKYGYIVDNPNVGPELNKVYWQPGNSKPFVQMVKELTGENFSPKALIHDVARALDETAADVKRAIEREQTIPKYEGPAKLNARVCIVHGDAAITSNANGESLEEVGRKFAAWLRSLEP